MRRARSRVSLLARLAAIGGIGASLCSALLVPASAFASTDNFGVGNGSDGAYNHNSTRTINTYTALTASPAAGATTLTVTAGTAANFPTDTIIMIWQTTGYTGTVTPGSTATTNLNATATGRYELAKVASVAGNTITMTAGLLNAYTAGSTQVLNVPQYTTVTNGGTMQAGAWDGTSGGIIAFMATNAVTNTGTITAAADGFRGGVLNDATSDECGCTEEIAPTTVPPGMDINAWAQKGEGLVPADFGTAVVGRARGNILSAGGGGDCDNAGGGGGGNGGPGGQGGDTWSGDGPSSTENVCVSNDANHVGRAVGGMAGAPLTYDMTTHLSFGGGGGAGQENNGAGGAGGAGGGVVWFRAVSMSGPGTIIATGGAGGGSQNDGAGGGGAGGDILVRLQGTCTGNVLNVSGGAGGTVVYGDDHGPGGGGGGGQVYYQSTSTLNGTGNCSTNVTAGAAGVWNNAGTIEGNKGATTPGTGGVQTSGGKFTAVTLMQFAHAPRVEGGETIAWETGAEIGTVGFYVRRDRSDGPRVQREIVLGKLMSPEGGRYSISDPLGRPGTRYFLEEVARDGLHTYGPAQVGSASSWLVRPTHLEHPVEAASRELLLRPVHVTPAAAYARVSTEGIYQVAPTALTAAGLPGVGGYRVSHEGAAQPTFLAPGGGFLFYASAPDSPDRAQDAYRLQPGPAPMMLPVAVGPAVGVPPATFVDTVHLQQHLVLDPGAPAAYRFCWAEVVSGASPTPITFDAQGLQSVTSLSVELRGQVDFGVPIEHHVQVMLNGTTIIDTTWGGLDEVSFSAIVPAGLLQPTGNVLTFNAPGDLGQPYDLFGLGSVDLVGARTYQAQNDALAFTSTSRLGIEVDGFSAPPVLLDITNPAAPIELVGAQLVRTRTGCNLRFQPPPHLAGHRFYAAVPQAPAVAASQEAGVPSGSASYVAIYADGMASALSPLLAQHQAEGLSVLSVDVQAIDDAFGYGEHGPVGVERYLAQLSPAPTSVLLVGKPSVDPHDYLSTGVPDLVPTVIHEDANAGSYLITDLPLVAGADGRTPFAAVGRLPVSSSAELAAWVTKLVGYAQTPGTPSGIGIYAADSVDPTTGNTDPFFVAESNRVAADLTLTPVLVDVPDQTNANLLQAAAQIPDLLTYHGHAGATVWSVDSLLSTADVPSFPNARPFLLVTVDCWDGMFAQPGLDPLTLQLAELPNGGAVAALAASTLVDESLDPLIDDALFQALADPTVMTAGELIYRAETTFAGESVPPSEVLIYSYNLIGDPASRLPLR